MILRKWLRLRWLYGFRAQDVTTSLVKLPCRSGYVLEVGRSRQHGNQADYQRVIYDQVGFSRLLTRLKPTGRGHSPFCAEIALLPVAPLLLREQLSSSLATR